MSKPTLHELNAHLFAALLGTAVTTVEATAPGKRGRKAAAAPVESAAATSPYTDDQRAALANVGVTAEQLADMPAAEVAAILETINKAV